MTDVNPSTDKKQAPRVLETLEADDGAGGGRLPNFTTETSPRQEQKAEDLARIEIRALLDNGSASDRPLEEFDSWADIVSELRQAGSDGGAADVRQVWIALVNASPGLARLVSGEPDPPPGSTPSARQSNGWLPIGDVLRALGRGEVGDAELLDQLYAGRVAFDHSESKFYLWGGHCWEIDERGLVGNLVDEIAAQYLHAAAEKRRTSDDDGKANEITVKALIERARILHFRNKITNVLALAKGQEALALSGREWDADPWLLGVANGVVNLRNGSFCPGRPADYIRTAAPTPWQGLEAPAPRWERFLSEIFAGNNEVVDFVRRLFGFAVTGLGCEHALVVLHGYGRNGKDTLLDVLAHVLGELASPISPQVLIGGYRASNAATPDLYNLRRLRLAWAGETGENARLNAAQVKSLTGGGLVTARPLYGKPVTFRPQYLLMLVTNHRPRVSADDEALWKRLVLIPFSESFVDNPQSEHEHLRDKDMAEKLKAEAAGILAWLVEGCLAWQQEGLNPPDVITQATAKYRTDEDIVAEFLTENCIETLGAEVQASKLYKQYKDWAKGYELKPMTNHAFGKRVKRRFEQKRRANGLWYIGLGLILAEENRGLEQTQF